MPMTLTLYSKEHCHLCDEAMALLAQLDRSALVIDIESSDELMAEYGLRIPVLADEQGRELGWPFDEAELRGFLSPEPGLTGLRAEG